MKMGLDMKHRVAVITGAGNGLGLAYARLLARQGASVVINDIGSVDTNGHAHATADIAVAEIVAGGGTAIASRDSVATRDGAEQIIAAAMDHFGRIDILINNAGIARHKPFEASTEADLRDILATHLEGGFHASQAAYRHMCKAKYGRILFTSSNSAAFGMPWATAYAAAKGGLLGLMKVLALEGAAHGVLSNALMPGAFTGMAQKMDPNEVPEAFRELYLACMRIEHRFTPEFVAPLVSYLVSEACTVTGEIYSAQSGHYARVFFGITEGWTSPDEQPPGAEDIARHFADIRDHTRYSVPHDAIADVNATGDALEHYGLSSSRLTQRPASRDATG
jgi:NAD(P)-dependent dehydrogenase (short-subunit alcohol dehydrogenase family)